MHATPGIPVSSGTLRDENLILSFWRALRVLNADRADELQNEVGQALLMLNEPSPLSEDMSERVQELITDLMNALDDMAPEGHYFGAHVGDAADFGYWPIFD